MNHPISNAIVTYARQVDEDVLAIDIRTDTPVEYCGNDDAWLSLYIDGKWHRRCFSLAGDSGGQASCELRLLMRRNPGGVVTQWVFDQFAHGELEGVQLQAHIRG